MRLIFTAAAFAGCTFVAAGDVIKVDTSGWVGAEFQPSKSANEDWQVNHNHG